MVQCFKNRKIGVQTGEKLHEKDNVWKQPDAFKHCILCPCWIKKYARVYILACNDSADSWVYYGGGWIFQQQQLTEIILAFQAEPAKSKYDLKES